MKRTVKICVGGAIFLGFSALLFLVFHLRSSDQNIRVVKIVVCGPMSGENRNDGEVMLKSTKLRIQQANENTSNTSIRFQVLPCNDENDPGIAKQAARQIVAAKNIYAVVGHLTSATSSAAGEIYKQAGIPAITATAASQAVITGNPWYFRTVVGNEQQGNLAAVYIHEILEHQNVTVIHDVDAYGQHLTDTFIHYWEDILGLKVKNVFPFGKRTSDTLRGWHGAREHAEYGDRPVDSQLNEIIARLELSGEPGMVFMAAHEAEAAELIKKMRNGGKNYQIFGGDSLSKATFVNRFTHDAMEKKFPGYYTDGIFATAHFLYDIAGWKAQEFFAEYWNTYGTNPDSSAASYYDSADLLVQTILALDFEKSIKEQREDIRNALANMDGPAKAFSGMTGDIYFDQHGGAIKPISVGYYQKSTIIAALNQLQRIYNSAEIPDPESVLKTGEVLIAGVDPLHNTSIYFEKTHVVYAGLHINEISDFDPRSLVHNMDFVLWFRYAHDFPLDDIIFSNAIEPVNLSEPVEEEVTPVYHYKRYHLQAKLQADFSDQMTGFDQHVLGLTFRHQTMTRHVLIFIPDILGMELDRHKSLTQQIEREHVLRYLTDWNLKNARIFQGVSQHTSLGRPRHLGSPVVYSNLNMELHITEKPNTLTDFVPKGLAIYLLPFCGVTIFLVEFLRRKHKNGRISALLILVIETLLGSLMLVIGKTLFVERFSGELNERFVFEALRAFKTLWWLAGGLLACLIVSRIFLNPIEKQAGRAIPSLVRRFIFTIIFTIACFGAITFVYEQPLTGLLATSGVIAMVIGLAIQMNISNVFSGIAINFERPFRVGDWIHIASIRDDRVIDYGQVIDINWRTTRIKSKDNYIMCIPNTIAADALVCNYSYPDDICRMRYEIDVDPLHQPPRVRKLLLDAVLTVKEILTTPAPKIRLKGFGNGRAIYEVVVFFRNYATKDDLRGILLEKIWRHLAQSGIEQAIPRQRLNVLQDTIEIDREEIERKILKQVEVFKPFSAESIEHLYACLQKCEFLPGQALMEQGEAGDSMFLILEGCIGISVLSKDGSFVEVVRREAGDIIGEMALLTGAPRSATVRAVTKTMAFEITKQDIAPLFEAQPETMKQLAELMTLRNMTQEDILDKRDFEKRKANLSKGVLTTIMNFFTKKE